MTDPPVPPPEGQPEPPRVWWDAVRGLLLIDRDVDYRFWFGDPAPNEAVELRPTSPETPPALAEALALLPDQLDGIADDSDDTSVVEPLRRWASLLRGLPVPTAPPPLSGQPDERYVVMGEWLVECSTICTCTNLMEPYDHEQGCGWDAIAKVEDLIAAYDAAPSEREAQLSEALRAMAARVTEQRRRYWDVAEVLGCGRAGTHEWVCGVARRGGGLLTVGHERLMKAMHAMAAGHDPRCQLVAEREEPACDCRIWAIFDQDAAAHPVVTTPPTGDYYDLYNLVQDAMVTGARNPVQWHGMLDEVAGKFFAWATEHGALQSFAAPAPPAPNGVPHIPNGTVPGDTGAGQAGGETRSGAPTGKRLRTQLHELSDPKFTGTPPDLLAPPEDVTPVCVCGHASEQHPINQCAIWVCACLSYRPASSPVPTGTGEPPLTVIPTADEPDSDRYARAYIQTAQADPELTGFHEHSEYALRSIGWALHGAGWMEPNEAGKCRAASPPTAAPLPEDRLEQAARAAHDAFVGECQLGVKGDELWRRVVVAVASVLGTPEAPEALEPLLTGEAAENAYRAVIVARTRERDRARRELDEAADILRGVADPDRFEDARWRARSWLAGREGKN